MADLEARFLGILSYSQSLLHMHKLHEQVVNNKIPAQLMLLEHEPVITLTRQHMEKSLKTSINAINNSGIHVAIADRGGDATFHGPGQLVGYPLIKVKTYDAGNYIRALEQSLLQAMLLLDIKAELVPGFTGVWLRSKKEKKLFFKKLIAIGVGIKDGVSKHGFAINIDINYERYSEHIIPCGLKDRGVATIKEAFHERSLEMPEYSTIVKTVSKSLADTFSLNLFWSTADGRKYHYAATG
jgi:lipoyl(octanoyl) transferase